MGLIDGMLGDLIGGSMGMEGRVIRKMVRRAGVRNLLMLGGAAALGGLAVAKAAPAASAPAGSAPGSRMQVPPRAGGGGPPVGGDVPPPPPPAPEAAGGSEAADRPEAAGAVPPPPPPAVTPGTPPPPPVAPEADDLDIDVLPAEAVLPAVRTMVAAALADGELSGEERSMVLGRIDDADLPEEAVRRIHQDLVLPPTPDELAALVTTPEAHETLYRLAAAVLKADGEATETERGWLDRLAAAFAIAPERKAALEHEVFGEDD